MKRRITLAAGLAATSFVLAACGSTTNHDMSSMEPGSMDHGSGQDMPGMSMNHDSGLSAFKDGYTLEVKSRLMGRMPISFAVLKDGKAVTSFQTEQTKKAHFYLIHSDLSGFQHLHPTMATDGTWSVRPSDLAPGGYRLYVQVAPTGTKEPIVLSRAATIAGPVSPERLPAPATTTTADGYTVTLAGQPTTGKELDVIITKDGQPVTSLEPYLETYAHVTAFRQGNLAFAHLHPLTTVKGQGQSLGGPALQFMVEIEQAGTYRLFIQFMTGGVLHTAAVTTTVA